jgi:DNA-binding response OmpR family regulator
MTDFGSPEVRSIGHSKCPERLAIVRRLRSRLPGGTILASERSASTSPIEVPGMSSKRILLVNDDRLLLRIFREKLEEQGFLVETARELENAQKAFETNLPDAIVMDLVFQSGNAFDFIKGIRATGAGAKVPILLLPSVLTRLGEAGIVAGATSCIPHGGDPLEAVVDAVNRSLGSQVPAPPADPAKPTGFFERRRMARKAQDVGSAKVAGAAADASKPFDLRTKSILSNAVEAINEMRHCLPGISTASPELSALHNLWNLAHAFALKAAFLSSRPLGRLVDALDILLHELNEAPEDLNPSTVRTVGQALDFLSTITTPGSMERLTDPSAANLLVVDDEDSARRFISSALEIAGLSTDCAASPSRAIEKLEGSRPDLIFLDVGLPEMNGFELCTKIRAVEAHKKTPIVFITGMATFQNKAKASLSGGNDFVGKPFNLPELGVKALIWLFRGQLRMV